MNVPVTAGSLPNSPVPCAASHLDHRPPAAASVDSPGAIMRVPDHVLELVFAWLAPADLARASRVCRQWYALASDETLQAFSLARTYPADHWQTLAKAMDPVRIGHWLDAWGRGAPDSLQQPTGQQDRARQRPSTRRLFYRLTRQLLQAERLTADEGNLCLRSSRIYTACSPDGQWLVTWHAQPWPQERGMLSLWRHRPAGVHRAALWPLEAGLFWHAAVFSADSQRLQVVDVGGTLTLWQRKSDDSWQFLRSLSLCRGRVGTACFSPDCRRLAIQSASHIRLFSETVPGLWVLDHDWQWKAEAPPDDPVPPWVEIMQFSNDSRLFVFVGGGQGLLFEPGPGGCRIQPVGDSRPGGVDAAVLSARGDWLALAIHDGPPAVVELPPWVPLRVQLWQGRAEQGWHCVAQHPCTGSGSGLCMVFSPDDRQLAFPDRQEDGSMSLCLLSVGEAGTWSRLARLAFGAVPALQGLSFFLDNIYEMNALYYSAQGRYLAALSFAGVQLWQRDGLSWTPLLWIENSDIRTPMRFVFSPDGRHCATATGKQGYVSVHGPGSRGGYGTRLEWTAGRAVDQLLFAPDTISLYVVSSGTGRRYPCPSHVTCLHLVPARWPAGPGRPDEPDRA